MTLRQFFNLRSSPKQVDFAAAIGCDPSYLNRIISGDRKAGAKYIPLIVKQTGGKVTARELNPAALARARRLLG